MLINQKKRLPKTQIYLFILAHITRGVPIYVADVLATDMLIFTVSVIGTVNQRSQFKCQYSTSKINFYLTHAKEHICYKIMLNGFLIAFIQLVYVYTNYNYTYFCRIILFTCISAIYGLDRHRNLQNYAS